MSNTDTLIWRCLFWQCFLTAVLGAALLAYDIKLDSRVTALEASDAS